MKKWNGSESGGEQEGGNEVKGTEGILRLLSAVNHSAGARDTKDPVWGLLCVSDCVFEWCDRSSTWQWTPSLCGHATASGRPEGGRGGGTRWEKAKREGNRREVEEGGSEEPKTEAEKAGAERGTAGRGGMGSRFFKQDGLNGGSGRF